MTETVSFTTQTPASVRQSHQPVAASGKDGRYEAPAVNRGYGQVVLDHFIHPRNAGVFDANDPDVGSALVGAVDQGGAIQMQIRVDGSGIINETRFKAYGCGATIAAASWTTEWAKGKSLEQVSGLRSTELIHALSLPPVKTHCAILAEDAIKAAVDNYTQRQE